jgi:hypothetical protein
MFFASQQLEAITQESARMIYPTTNPLPANCPTL